MDSYKGGFKHADGKYDRDELLLNGALLPIQVDLHPAVVEAWSAQGIPRPAPISGFALLDTGAISTAIDERAMKKLGVPPAGFGMIGTAGGTTERMSYPARIVMPSPSGNPLFVWDRPRMMSLDLNGIQTRSDMEVIAVWGRDLLAESRLIYDGFRGEFEIFFSTLV